MADDKKPDPKPPLISAAGAPAGATPGPGARAAVPEGGMARRELLQLGPIAIPWLGVAWATFTATMGIASAATARFMYPNVLFEPPSSFKAGFPEDYAPQKVDERWKNG